MSSPKNSKKEKEVKTKPKMNGDESSSSKSVRSPTAKDKEIKEKGDERPAKTTLKGETVLTPDPKNFEIKHHLQVPWTMWYNAPTTKGDWKPKSIITFDSVEDFWCLYNNLVPPTKLVKGSNYHMFKEGVLPEWEDANNKDGGKWTVTFAPRDSSQDEAWLYTLLALIGEEFEDSDEICGVVVSPRAKQNKLALWTRTARDKDSVLRIGKTLKEILGVKNQIVYQAHEVGGPRQSEIVYTI